MFNTHTHTQGKGTISGRIIKNFDIIHLSTGDVLRTNIEKCTALGIEAESYIKKGKLVPDESMINVIMHELKDIKDRSFLLDGFPRTRVQAEKLDKVQKIDCVINLVVPYEIITGNSIIMFIFFQLSSLLPQRARQITLCTPAKRSRLQS